FGGLAEFAGIRPSFAAVGVVAIGCAILASLPRSAAAESVTANGVSRAFRDPRFLGGLWLNTPPAFLFRVLAVLVPLALDARGWWPLAIARAFFVAGLAEVVITPVLGRLSDRIGRLRPIRVALAVSAVVAVALAAADEPIVLAILVSAAAVSFGG